MVAPALPIPNPGAAVDALSSCRGVIGIDTGLTHIAVQQRTPTVTICRQGSVYFRPWPHARALRGAPCDAACLTEERMSAYNERVSLRGFQWQARTCPLRAAVPGGAATGTGGAPAGRAGVTVASGTDRPVEVDAHSEIGVRNSQPEGIGRVADLGDLVAWNNLGRNVVFADRRWQPVAVFGTTVFVDDELSQYDLDVHAILHLAGDGEGLVVTLNHLGSVLGFAEAEVVSLGHSRSKLSSSRPVSLVEPVLSTTFADDLERTVAIGAQLVSSRAPSSPEGGLLVSEPVHAGIGKASLDAGGGSRRPGGGSLPSVPSASAATSCSRSAARAVPRWWRSTTGGSSEGCSRLTCLSWAAAFAWDGLLLWAAGSEELATSGVDDYRWGGPAGGSLRRPRSLERPDGRRRCLAR